MNRLTPEIEQQMRAQVAHYIGRESWQKLLAELDAVRAELSLAGVEVKSYLGTMQELTEENARLRGELEAELLRTHMLKPVMDEYERLKAQKESILAKQQDVKDQRITDLESRLSKATAALQQLLACFDDERLLDVHELLKALDP